jgi:hypothetical protein
VERVADSANTVLCEALNICGMWFCICFFVNILENAMPGATVSSCY